MILKKFLRVTSRCVELCVELFGSYEEEESQITTRIEQTKSI